MCGAVVSCCSFWVGRVGRGKSVVFVGGSWWFGGWVVRGSCGYWRLKLLVVLF